MSWAPGTDGDHENGPNGPSRLEFLDPTKNEPRIPGDQRYVLGRYFSKQESDHQQYRDFIQCDPL